jgi:integrase/recombinase XerD
MIEVKQVNPKPGGLPKKDIGEMIKIENHIRKESDCHNHTIDLFKELQDGFKEYLRVKNQSRMTIDSYLQGVRQLLGYLVRRGIDDIREVTKDTLRDYQHYLTQCKTKEGNPYTVNTLHVKLRGAQKFFDYLERTKQILYNPALVIKMPDLGKRLPKNIITKDEAKRILNQPNTSTMLGIRDKTILELLYSTGIRLEELYQLTVYDVDYGNGFLRVNKGKFAKDRVLPLGSMSCKYLREYIKQVRPRLTRRNKDERALFIGKCGRRIHKLIIERMVKDYAQEAGVKKRVTPHTWRHSFASHLLADGADVIHVQKLLGHSSPDITQIYTKVTPKDVKEMHFKKHPREKDQDEAISVKKGIPCQGKYNMARI